MTEPGDKPRTIKLAAWFALVVGVSGTLQAIVAFGEKRTVEAGLAEVGKYMSVDQAIYRTTNLRGSVSLALALGICCVVLFAPMALLISRRVRWARIATWVIGAGLIAGEVVLMAADSSAVKTGKFVLDTDVPGNQPDLVASLNRMLVPDWFPPLHYAAELLVLIGLIGACVQLLRPASSEYFHPEETETAEDARVWSTSKMRTGRTD